MNVYLKKQNFLWQKISVRILILVIILVTLNIFKLEIKNIFYYVSSPVMNTFRESGSGIYNFFQSSFNFNGLKEENNNLKEENQKLLSEVSSLQFYLRESGSIQKALENVKDSNLRILSSHIIGLDTANDYMLINKGANDGVLENMPVISSQKVVFGKVIKVYENFSQVMLISNKSSVLDAKIQHDDPEKLLVHGVVKGKSNLSVYLDLVSPDSEIKEGDVLVTSGLEGTLPSGLIIGKITSVTKDDLKPFQTAQVQTLFDAKSIDSVFVITNY